MSEQAKRRPAGTGSLSRRKDGRWVGKWYVAGVQMAVYGRTREAVERKLASRMAQAAEELPRWGIQRQRNGMYRVYYEDDQGRVRWVVRSTRDDARLALKVARTGKDPRRKRAQRGALSRSVRFSILERCGFACFYCGARPPGISLHIDHVVPVIAGGTDDDANLVAACTDCNLGKAARPVIVDGGRS